MAAFRYIMCVKKVLDVKKHQIFVSQKFLSDQATSIQDDEEFRVLELYPMKNLAGMKGKARSMENKVLPPREKSMPIDQDWPSIWPSARAFQPSLVPLPLHQGYDQKRVSPGKYANTELMKIPNFLHLTPPAIKQHCAAIKKFCTEWPTGLVTEEDIDKHFPVKIITSDYCHSSPTIRDERSRIVTLKIKMRSLNLNYHGRDKLFRLIGKKRFNSSTDTITIVADRCPLRKQNYDYLIYLLTALHHESWITEPWEHEKTEADMEKFFFENSRIQKKITSTVQKLIPADKQNDKETNKNSEDVVSFGEAVTELINGGESEESLQKYKLSVLKALGIKQSASPKVS